MNPFLYLGLLAALIVAGNVWLSRQSRKDECCPACSSADAFDADMESEAKFATHTAAALRLVAGDNVHQLPVQRRAGEFS